MLRKALGGCADLELALRRRDEHSYTLDLRFSLPDSEADIRLQRGAPISITLPRDELARLTLDPQQYGSTLTASLFADTELHAALCRAIESAQQAGVPVRLRLDLDETAPELHSLRWETLHHPPDRRDAPD